ncbi:hypothetical protein DYQ86_15380 [Acidobacteria bacterium AB60]|nr:hypothetical protein DYQ86_15380 [Acidobacteria bacterium AB60]
MKPKAMVSWSGGKDCYLALSRAREGFEIAGLLTMMTEDGQRSRSHGLRPELLQAQANLLGIPHLMEPATWADYEIAFGKLLARARAQGASHIIFGDIYPQANRTWVETVSAREGLIAVEPLWAESTEKLARVPFDAVHRHHYDGSRQAPGPQLLRKNLLFLLGRHLSRKRPRSLRRTWGVPHICNAFRRSEWIDSGHHRLHSRGGRLFSHRPQCFACVET